MSSEIKKESATDVEDKGPMLDVSVVAVPEGREPESLCNLSQEEIDKMTRTLVRKVDAIIL